MNEFKERIKKDAKREVYEELLTRKERTRNFDMQQYPAEIRKENMDNDRYYLKAEQLRQILRIV